MEFSVLIVVIVVVVVIVVIVLICRESNTCNVFSTMGKFLCILLLSALPGNENRILNKYKYIK